MKIWLSFILLLNFNLLCFAQSPLPVSWNCEGNVPEGFSYNGLTHYSPSSTSCSSAPSLKFSKNGDVLVMRFAQCPGRILFNIKAQSTFNGVFRIQESADGNLWTNIREYRNNTNPTITTTCVRDSVLPALPQNTTRFIRFINAANVNVEIDEILVRAPRLSVPELYLTIQGNNIINNGNAPALSTTVGSSFPYSIALRNLTTSSSVLKIDSVRIIGAAKNDYSITNSTPFNIATGATTNLLVNFTPSVAGSRQARLLIYSNSSSNPLYVINLNGVGGTYASTPEAQNNATSIKFYNVKTYRYTVSIKVPTAKTLDANGGYMVVRTVDAPLTINPDNGVFYNRGSGFGNGKVVYNGNISDSIRFNPTWVHAGKTYYFYVFPYNGAGTTTAYLTSDILSATVTTPATLMPPNEYSAINPLSVNFVSDLKSLINPHTAIPYSEYARTMIDLFETRDTQAVFNNVLCERVITCAYSGLNQPYTYPLVWNKYDFSREHSFAHSWMPTYPADDDPELPEYNDQHNLYPTSQTKANAPRCNYPLGEVVSSTYTFLNCKLGNNTNGQRVFEPRDEHKGRVARAIMYMSVAYNSPSANWGYPNCPPDGMTCSGTPIPYKQDEFILKKWNYLYPPTGYEIARNDFLDSLQGNRNPFTDHPEWACYIDFKDMKQQANTDTLCQKMIGYNEPSLELKTHLFPNPSSGSFTFAVLETFKKASLEIYDIHGRKLFFKDFENQNFIEETFATDNWSGGIYLLKFLSEKGNLERKFIVE